MGKIFTDIYKNNTWGDKESLSGPASNLPRTKNLRKVLPELAQLYNIKTMIDAPCGDMFWFSKIKFKKKIKYYGYDIVEEIIEQNKETYKKDRNYTFEQKNVIKEKLPKVDLIFCRDLIIHLPINSVYELLYNFVQSDSKYLLITQHILTNEPDFINKDIEMGAFTYRNLTQAPFNFPLPKFLIPEEWPDKKVIRCLAMYDLKTIEEYL